MSSVHLSTRTPDIWAIHHRRAIGIVTGDGDTVLLQVLDHNRIYAPNVTLHKLKF